MSANPHPPLTIEEAKAIAAEFDLDYTEHQFVLDSHSANLLSTKLSPEALARQKIARDRADFAETIRTGWTSPHELYRCWCVQDAHAIVIDQKVADEDHHNAYGED